MEAEFMEIYNTARRRLRFILALLFLSELPVAIYLLFFPYHFQQVFDLTVGSEPFFIREIGNFLLFATYFQFIAFRNPERNLLAVQFTLVLRVLAGMLEFVEVNFILKSYNLFYFSLLFFCVSNFLLAYLIIHYLRRMKLKWIEI